ncbi:hypothetical protein [Labilithrix luteola]|nr:hypothetical protein [Labilithrix luteola]
MTFGNVDAPGSCAPRIDAFVERRLDWAKPLGVLEFTDMPS